MQLPAFLLPRPLTQRQVVGLPQDIPMHPLTSASNTSLAGDKECPITLMSISALPPGDIHTTPGGICYYKPALKLWLREHSTMPVPHIKDDAAVEKRKLFPEVDQVEKIRKRAKIYDVSALYLGTTSGIFSVAGGGMTFKSFSKNFIPPSVSEEYFECWQPYLDPSPEKSVQNVSDCLAQLRVPHGLDLTLFRPLGYAFLGIAAGAAIGTALFAINRRLLMRNANELLRPVGTDEIIAMGNNLPEAVNRV